MSESLEYLSGQMLPLSVSLLSQIVTNWICVSETFFLSKNRIPVSRLFLGVFAFSALELLPLFAANHYLHGSVYSYAAYCVLLFPFPAILFVYYLIYRYIFRTTSGLALMSLEWLLMGQYLVLLLFSFFVNVWMGILDNNPYCGTMFLPDLFALICANLVAAGTYVALRRYVSRTKHFLVVSSHYSSQNIFLRIVQVIVSLLPTYIMLVSVTLLLFRQYRVDFSFAITLFYLIITLLLGYKLINQYNKNRLIVDEWHMKETEKYIDSLLEATADFHQVKHDFYNILQIYGGYLSNSDIRGLRKYHQSLVKTVTRAGANLDMIESLRGRVPIHSLLAIKKNQAESHDVRLDIQQAGSLVPVSMDDLDLCRVLSNLLDNAIQAAAECDDKLVRMLCRERKSTVTVEISNPSPHFVPLEKVFVPGFTTKEQHAGQGLPAVKKIIETHQNCAIRVDFAEDIFSVTLELETV